MPKSFEQYEEEAREELQTELVEVHGEDPMQDHMQNIIDEQVKFFALFKQESDKILEDLKENWRKIDERTK